MARSFAKGGEGKGTSGEGRQILTADEMAHYRDRVAAMAPHDMVAWLHRDRED